MKPVLSLLLTIVIWAVTTAAAPAQDGSLRLSTKSDQRICGHSQIRGQELDRIASRTQGCGIQKPVSVSSVAGVQLSPAATMDCSAARSLRRWVQRGLKPAFRKQGGVKIIRVYDHYNCRPRNNVPGAKVSMHGSGRAIDIGSFTLGNGQKVSILEHWKDPAWSRTLRSLHRKACGPFNTVLGPDHDRAHRNHFHFDTGGRGRFCR
jgi:hypothetical protein